MSSIKSVEATKQWLGQPSLQSKPIPKHAEEFFRGTVPYEFSFPHGNFQKIYRDEIAKEVAAFEVDHLRRHGGAPGFKRIESVRREVEKKYSDQHEWNRERLVLWQRSQRILDLLRTKGTVPEDTAVGNENFGVFVKTINPSLFPEFDPASPFYMGESAGGIPSAFTSNQYFEATQPKLVGLYGPPFFTAIATETARYPNHYEPAITKTERITGINTAFWSGYLGGDHRLHHDVIFYLPEDRFYFFDLAVGCYVPTSEAKLALSVSLSLRQCAYGQQMETAKLILEKFTTKAVLNQILDHAKALLAADVGLFIGPHAKSRWTGPQGGKEAEASPVAIQWVQDCVEPADNSVMPLSEVLERFPHHGGDTRVNTSARRQQIEQAIRHVYPARGLRNDLHLPDGKGVKGWKGLRLRVRECLDGDVSPSSHFCPESGRSDNGIALAG